MRNTALVSTVCIALALGGCGGNTGKNEKGPTGSTSGSGTSAEEGTTGPPAQESTGSDPRAAKRRVIYLDARTLCSAFGVRQVVRRFGLQAGSADAVARAYAKRNYTDPFRDAGYRGCLAGFNN